MSQLKKFVAGAAAAAGLAIASPASALVMQWEATFENGFEAGASTTWGVGVITELGATTVGGANAFTMLRWGSAPSGLDISPGIFNGASSVDVATNGPTVDTVSITHLNRVIGCPRGNPDGTPNPAGSICLNALQDTVVLTELMLTALDFPMPGTDTPLPSFGTREIDIRFAETFNQANQAACGFPEQGLPPPSAPCKDIFTILDPADLSFSFVFLDGIEYFVEIGVAGLQPLSAQACALVGLGAGCVGLTTPEGADSVVLANIRIFTAPEPGSLAILALGLLALGAVTRRKRT
jgi:hypothetical protein